jgi:hypothetical protein
MRPADYALLACGGLAGTRVTRKCRFWVSRAAMHARILRGRGAPRSKEPARPPHSGPTAGHSPCPAKATTATLLAGGPCAVPWTRHSSSNPASPISTPAAWPQYPPRPSARASRTLQQTGKTATQRTSWRLRDAVQARSGLLYRRVPKCGQGWPWGLEQRGKAVKPSPRDTRPNPRRSIGRQTGRRTRRCCPPSAPKRSVGLGRAGITETGQ